MPALGLPHGRHDHPQARVADVDQVRRVDDHDPLGRLNGGVRLALKDLSIDAAQPVCVKDGEKMYRVGGPIADSGG